MILVDTSIWIDHLHAQEPVLAAHLRDDAVGCHPYVIEELALGSIAARDRVLGLLASLRHFPVVTHGELLELVGRRGLWGRDRRLLTAAREIGIPCHG